MASREREGKARTSPVHFPRTSQTNKPGHSTVKFDVLHCVLLSQQYHLYHRVLHVTPYRQTLVQNVSHAWPSSKSCLLISSRRGLASSSALAFRR